MHDILTLFSWQALGAIVVGHGQYCFITEMDTTATMDMVKEELRLLNNVRLLPQFCPKSLII